MNTPKIKILKDTPFDLEGTEMSVSDFRLKYGYICTKDVDDNALIHYLKSFISYPSLKQAKQYDISDWFEVIELKPRFVVGDWVWHEQLQKAFRVTNHSDGRTFWPNFVTGDAANEFSDIYKRPAKQSEIDDHKLTSYCGGTVLIGRLYFYYFDNIWKHISGVTYNISMYLRTYKKYQDSFHKVGVIKGDSIHTEFEYPVRFSGLQIGCKTISHLEIIEMARQLNLL